MNKNLNIEDIQKFTKYQLKLHSLQSGGGKDNAKENIYNQKIDEYSYKLQKSGVDTKQLTKLIQQGGDPTEMLRQLKQAIDEKMQSLGGINADMLEELTLQLKTKLQNAQEKNLELTEKYHQFVTESKGAFLDIYGNISQKAKAAKIPDQLTQLALEEEKRDIPEPNFLEDLDQRILELSSR